MLRGRVQPGLECGHPRHGLVVPLTVQGLEATHVALSAAVSDLPLWLVEGFADYVALRDVEVPVRRSAAELTAWVRRHGALTRLPGAGGFDETP